MTAVLTTATAAPSPYQPTVPVFAARAVGATKSYGKGESAVRALDAIAAPTKFDSENANLAQTIAYNLGFGPDGSSARTQVLTKRTFVLVLSSFVNTFIRVFATIQGTEIVGALGWSALWAGAGLLTGIAYGWVAEE